MKINKLLAAALASTLLFASCNNDDDSSAPLGVYDRGILVLNEGGLGTVTYISDDLQTVQQDIFTAVNGDDAELGAYAQSMFFEGNFAYIISNGSNKITKVNRFTFEKIGEVSTGLAVPRYGLVRDGKAYVTNSNTFESATDDFVAVIDVDALEVVNVIPVNNQAERIVEASGKLYVSGGFYGAGNAITVIGVENEQIIDTIDVGESPNSLEEEDGMLYVLCSTWGGPSKLVKIRVSDHEIVGETPFAASILNAQNLDLEDNYVYFTSGANIYRADLGAASVADMPFVQTNSESDYIGYGFAVEDGRIYISEAAEDFASDGKILIYSEQNGELIDEIPAGLGPNGFYFN